MMLRRNFTVGAVAAPLMLAGARAQPEFDAPAIVKRLAELSRQEYQDAAIGNRLADALLERLGAGAYAQAATPSSLASLLMRDVAAVSQDKHFYVMAGMHHGGAPSIRPGKRLKRPDAPLLSGMQSDNFGVRGVEILPGNIGRIDLRRFYAPYEETAAKFGAVMSVISDTWGLVIDLTHNIGGDPASVALLSSYLFEGAPFVLNRFIWRSSGVEEFSTTRDLVGPAYGSERPVAVTVAAETFSAAEEFAYNLQALKRAVVVGETTAGGANHAEMFSVGGDIAAFIPCARAENPVTKTNWEGVGVKPDMEAASAAVQAVAHRTVLQEALTSADEKRKIDVLTRALTLSD